ncbi:hypothetical protein [Sphingobacterium detergens]
MKRLLFLFLFVLKDMVAPAQGITDVKFPEVNFPSTNVRDLGRFGSFQTNLSRGQAQIDIPVYTISTGRYEYPITLSYNHSGIKVDEKSGIVGMNWSLIGQGVISRIVNGRPDEDGSYGYNIMYPLVTSKTSYTPTSLTSDPYYLATKGYHDLEPDYFVFSFNGKSGSFFYDPKDQNYYSMPYSKLKIRHIGYHDGFEIIDELGYVYEFNQYTETNSTSEVLGMPEVITSYKSQWYLTKVKKASGETIVEIQYLDNNVDTELRETETAVYRLSSGGNCNFGLIDLERPAHLNKSMLQTVLQEKLPKKILWTGGALDLQYSAQTNGKLKLDRIQLMQGNTMLRNWRLFYSPYVGRDKIKLDSIAEVGDQRMTHKFSYNQQAIGAYQSFAQDYWGYFNGANNTRLIPKTRYEYVEIGFADREAKFDFCQAGILEAITYPTGGKSVFEYELNKYPLQDSIPIFGSGGYISVSRKYSTQGTGTSQSAQFTLQYQSDVDYTSYRDNCDDRKPGCSFEPCGVQIEIVEVLTGKRYLIQGGPKIAVSGRISLPAGTYRIEILTLDGLDFGTAGVSYTKVIGYQKEGTAGGLRIKNISNFDSENVLLSSKAFEYTLKGNGQISSGRSVGEKNYMMQLRNGSFCGGNPSSPSNFPYCNTWFEGLYLSSYSNSNIFYAEGSTVSYTRVLEHEHSNGIRFTKEHLFSYDNDVSVRGFPYSAVSSRSWRRGLPLETNYYDANGRKLKTEIKRYAYDETRNRHVISGVRVGLYVSCPHSNLDNKIAFGSYDYLSEWVYLNESIDKEYVYENGSLRDSIVHKMNYYYDNPLHGQLSRTVEESSDGKVISKFVSFPNDFQSGTNWIDNLASKHILAAPIEILKFRKVGIQQYLVGGTLSYYKDQGEGLLDRFFMIKEEKPVKKEDFRFANGGLGIMPPFSQNGPFLSDSRYKLENTVVLYDGYSNIREIKQVGGFSTTYLWGYNGQYPIAEIKNATYSEVLTVLTQAEIDALNNPVHTESVMETLIKNAETKLRNHANLSKAMITSYTYRPLVGMTSKTDARGIIETYKYDGMERLHAILDQVGNVTKAIDYNYRPN